MGKPLASPFAVMTMSGRMSGPVVSPELAGAAHPCLDFVHDEHDAVPVGAFAQPLQEGGRGRNVAAVAEDGFDDEPGRIGGGADGLQEVIEFLQREGNSGVFVPAVSVGVGEGGDMHSAHQRRESGAELGAGGGQRGRAHRPAVESAVERDDVGSSGGHPGQADRGLDRFGAGGGVEDAVESRGQEVTQLLGELEQRRVHHRRVLGMNDLADLFTGRGDDIRVAVPGAGDTDSGGEVEVLLAVGRVHPTAGRVVDDDGSGLLEGGTESCHDLILS